MSWVAIVFFTIWPQMAMNRVSQQKQHVARQDIVNIAGAVDMFEVDTGRFPTTAEGLTALVEPPAGLKEWHGPYLKRIPVDPWGQAYIYCCPGKHNKREYDVWTIGPDGFDGSGDDIGNWE